MSDGVAVPVAWRSVKMWVCAYARGVRERATFVCFVSDLCRGATALAAGRLSGQTNLKVLDPRSTESCSKFGFKCRLGQYHFG